MNGVASLTQLICVGLLVYFPNRYTTRGVLLGIFRVHICIVTCHDIFYYINIFIDSFFMFLKNVYLRL